MQLKPGPLNCRLLMHTSTHLSFCQPQPRKEVLCKLSLTPFFLLFVTCWHAARFTAEQAAATAAQQQLEGACEALEGQLDAATGVVQQLQVGT